MRVVFDTSILVAAARSRDGASFALVSSIPSPRFQICLSVGLYTEWQDVLSRREHLPPGQTPEGARGFVRYLAGHAHLQDIDFLWRPFLPAPDDDRVLELALASGCGLIVTHHLKDFRGCGQFGGVAQLTRAVAIDLPWLAVCGDSFWQAVSLGNWSVGHSGKKCVKIFPASLCAALFSLPHQEAAFCTYL